MIKNQIILGFVLVTFSITQIAVFFTQMFIGVNFIEPFLLLGFFIISKDIKFRAPIFSVLKSKAFGFSILFLSLFFIIGLLTSGNGSAEFPNPIQNCYSDFRASILAVFVFFLLTSEKWEIKNRELFLVYMLWPFIFFDVISSMLLTSSSDETVRVLNAVPSVVVVLMILYLRKDKFIIALGLLSICGYHAVFSFSRNYILIFIIGYLFYMYFLIFGRKTKINYFKKQLLLSLTVFLPLILVPVVYSFWEADVDRSIHTIELTQQLIDSKGGTESQRTNSLVLPFTDTDFYMLPHGLGWKNHIGVIQSHYTRGELWSSMDSTVYYLFYHYGFLIGLVLNVIILGFVLKSIFSKKNQRDRIIKSCCAILFLSSYFTQSTTMTMLQFAFGNSMLFALLYEKVRFSDYLLKKRIHYTLL